MERGNLEWETVDGKKTVKFIPNENGWWFKAQNDVYVCAFPESELESRKDIPLLKNIPRSFNNYPLTEKESFKC